MSIWFEPYTHQIKNTSLKTLTVTLLTKYNNKITTMPPSLSGRFHNSESTIQQHLERVFLFALEFTKEFCLSSIDKDILLSSALLHDIGNCEYADKKRDPDQYQRLYTTGFNRSREAYKYHPILSEALILNHMLATTKQADEAIIQVAMVVSTHMDHWQPECPQPQTFIQKLLALADYLASKSYITIDTKAME